MDPIRRAQYCPQQMITRVNLVIFLLGATFIFYEYSAVSSIFKNYTTNDTVNVKPADSCMGKYIFVHDLPERFNQELVKNCHLLTKGTDTNMCPYLDNFGFGPRILSHEKWFSTSQFSLEVIFHQKMINYYRCLTNDSSIASAIYVPFYAGFDISLHLWGFPVSVRDASAIDLLNWLVKKPEWKRMSGMDHFLVAGRISWDFRRQTDNESDWGSKLRFLPESTNMSMLSIEASSWNNDFAIPYPTGFHPSTDSDVFQWQEKVRSQNRTYLFSFAGAPRPGQQDSIRGKIIEHCLAAGSACILLDCDFGATNCDNPVNVMKVFQRSVFCLQPAGDSFTRRSVFEAILAGCIPVFFHPGTAYAQYLWHLPKNHSTYSVYIPVSDVKDWKPDIKKKLLRIPQSRVLAMREEVIKLIPSILYSDPMSKLTTLEDAFDLAVKGILERIDTVRSNIREGRDPSFSFSEKNENKYSFSTYDSENRL